VQPHGRPTHSLIVVFRWICKHFVSGAPFLIDNRRVARSGRGVGSWVHLRVAAGSVGFGALAATVGRRRFVHNSPRPFSRPRWPAIDRLKVLNEARSVRRSGAQKDKNRHFLVALPYPECKGLFFSKQTDEPVYSDS
jgi:hypothetical protein